MANRYSQLIGHVLATQPETILEIGTWNGARAVEMLKVSPRSYYYGFDLFDGATEETDRLEFNVKRHCSMAEVAERLKATGFPQSQFRLIKGNTRETLRNFPHMVDLAYIDGGHSVETIRSDWENVRRIIRPGGVVVFDDWYSGMDQDRLEFVGCNRVLEAIADEYVANNIQGSITILPLKDPVAGGGWVQMAFLSMSAEANNDDIQGHDTIGAP